jgi:plastocyanin
LEESFDLMEPGIEKKIPENKEPDAMKNTFKDLGVIIGFIFIYIVLYQYVSTGDISNGIDLQNDVNLILSDTQNFAFVPGSAPSSVPASIPASDPSSTLSSVPASVPASDTSSTLSSVPTNIPVSGSSSPPSSVHTSVPASGSSPAPSSVPTSVPASGSSPAPSSVPASVPISNSSSALSSVTASVPSPSPVPAESPDPIVIEPKIHEIRMDINGFYPNVISINKSDTIIWANVEDQRPRVVLLSKDGLFKNQVLLESNRFEYRFLKKGNYSFVLAEHPSLIEYQKAKGNVIVN